MTYGRRLPPTGLYAALSSDGRTWSEQPLLIRATPDSNQGYSSSVQLSDGTIFTANYSSRHATLPMPSNTKGPGLRQNGSPTGGTEAGDATGITGTFWRLPPPLT